MNHPFSVSDDAIVDAVRDALADTSRDRVTKKDISKHCELQPISLTARLQNLEDDGRVESLPSLVQPGANAYRTGDRDE